MSEYSRQEYVDAAVAIATASGARVDGVWGVYPADLTDAVDDSEKFGGLRYHLSDRMGRLLRQNDEELPELDESRARSRAATICLARFLRGGLDADHAYRTLVSALVGLDRDSWWADAKSGGYEGHITYRDVYIGRAVCVDMDQAADMERDVVNSYAARLGEAVLDGYRPLGSRVPPAEPKRRLVCGG